MAIPMSNKSGFRWTKFFRRKHGKSTKYQRKPYHIKKALTEEDKVRLDWYQYQKKAKDKARWYEDIKDKVWHWKGKGYDHRVTRRAARQQTKFYHEMKVLHFKSVLIICKTGYIETHKSFWWNHPHPKDKFGTGREVK